jgi:hypothetical protein
VDEHRPDRYGTLGDFAIIRRVRALATPRRRVSSRPNRRSTLHIALNSGIA